MSDLDKQLVQFSAARETVNGTPETEAGSDFMEITDSGATFNREVEKKETPVLTGNRYRKRSRKTIVSGNGSVTSWLRAGDAPGDEPESGVLLESTGFDATNGTLAARIVSGVNSSSTTTLLVSDTTGVNVGDVHLIKESEKSVNDDHISPVLSFVANTSITYEVDYPLGYSDNVEIEKSRNYKLNGNQVSFTARKWFSSAIKQEIPGCVMESLEFTIEAGEVPTLTATFKGLNNTETKIALAVTPTYDSSEPAFAIEACLFKDGVSIEAHDINFSYGQTASIKKTLCAANVNKSSKGRGVYETSGTFNVYKQDTAATDLSASDTVYSLFISLHVLGAGDGSKENVIAFNFPRVKTDTNDSNSDIEENITEAVTFMAEPTDSEDTVPTIMFS